MPSAIAIRKIEGKPGQVYYPLEKITVPEPKPKDDEVPISTPPTVTHTHTHTHSLSLSLSLLTSMSQGRHNPTRSRTKPSRSLHPPTPLPRHNLWCPPPCRWRRYRNLDRQLALCARLAQQTRASEPRHWLEGQSRWARAPQGLRDNGRHQV